MWRLFLAAYKANLKMAIFEEMVRTKALNKMFSQIFKPHPEEWGGQYGSA